MKEGFKELRKNVADNEERIMENTRKIGNVTRRLKDEEIRIQENNRRIKILRKDFEESKDELGRIPKFFRTLGEGLEKIGKGALGATEKIKDEITDIIHATGEATEEAGKGVGEGLSKLAKPLMITGVICLTVIVTVIVGFQWKKKMYQEQINTENNKSNSEIK